MNTSSLSVGQKFKNLQELSLLVLGEKLPPGKGRTDRIKQMQQYFSWKKIRNSQKIVITEIYSTKRVPLNSRCKYAPLIYKALSDYQGELVFTKTELLHALGILNDNFKPENFVLTANTLHVKYKVLKIITLDMYTKLNEIVMKSLKQLQKCNYISIEESKRITYYSPHVQPVSPDIIDKIYKEKKELLSCENYFDVIKKNLMSDYKILCNDALHDLGIQCVFNTYKISILRPLENIPQNQSLNTLCKEFLLKRYSKDSLATRVIDYYTKSREG